MALAPMWARADVCSVARDLLRPSRGQQLCDPVALAGGTSLLAVHEQAERMTRGVEHHSDSIRVSVG